MKKIYINTDEIIEKFKAENEDYKDKELTISVYEKSYSIKYRNEILQNVSALDGYTFETVADIFQKEKEIWLNRNKLKGQFKERYPEYKDKEITVKIYPYSMEFWCDNKRVYEEQANKGMRYIDHTEIDAEWEEESKKRNKSIYELSQENEDLSRENQRLKEELEELKKNKNAITQEETKAKSGRTGRPKLEMKDLEPVKNYIECGFNQKEICEMLEIDKATFYRHKRALKLSNALNQNMGMEKKEPREELKENEYIIKLELDESQIEKLKNITEKLRNMTDENGKKNFEDYTEQKTLQTIFYTGSKHLIDEKLEKWNNYIK